MGASADSGGLTLSVGPSRCTLRRMGDALTPIFGCAPTRGCRPGRHPLRREHRPPASSRQRLRHCSRRRRRCGRRHCGRRRCGCRHHFCNRRRHPCDCHRRCGRHRRQRPMMTTTGACRGSACSRPVRSAARSALGSWWPHSSCLARGHMRGRRSYKPRCADLRRRARGSEDSDAWLPAGASLIHVASRGGVV